MSDYEKLTPDSENRGDGQFVKTLQGQFGEGGCARWYTCP